MSDHGKTDLFRDLVAYFSKGVHSHHTYTWLMHQGSLACVDKVENGTQAVDLIFSRPDDAFLERFPDTGVPIVDVRWMDASLVKLTLGSIEPHRLQCSLNRSSAPHPDRPACTQNTSLPHSSKPHSFASTSTAASGSTIARNLIRLHDDDDIVTRDAVAAVLIPPVPPHRLADIDQMNSESRATRPPSQQTPDAMDEINNNPSDWSDTDVLPDENSTIENNGPPRSPVNSFVHPDDTLHDSPHFEVEADLTFSTSPSASHQSFSPSIPLQFSPPLQGLDADAEDVKPDVSRLALEARYRRISNEARRLSKRKLDASAATDVDPAQYPLSEPLKTTRATNAAESVRSPLSLASTRKASRAPVSKADKLIATAALGSLRPTKKIKQEPADTHYSLYNNAGSPKSDAYDRRIWGVKQTPLSGQNFEQGLIPRRNPFR